MKNLLFVSVFAFALLFSSCGANQATVDAMSSDMCKIMVKYNPDDITSLLDVSSEIMALKEKEGYGSVSDTQLLDAMNKNCPEGAKKLQSILDMAK
jgi:hypothetical protein